MNQRIQVLIADDQRSARDGLRALLTLYPEFEVVGLACNGQEAVQMAEEYRPDVILMDIQMPVMDGLEAIKLVKEKWPMIKVIALTMYIDNKDEALAAGADMHLLKGFDAEILYKDILSMIDGSVRTSPVTGGISRTGRGLSSPQQE